MSRADLLRRIGDVNDFSRPRPLVTVAEFFDGNDDPASIGYNLPDPQPPAAFAAVLTGIAGRPEVHDVRIEVKDLEDPDGWPTTDSVWIITRAPVDTVRGWFPAALAPDELGVSASGQGGAVEPIDVPAGHSAVVAFWD